MSGDSSIDRTVGSGSRPGTMIEAEERFAERLALDLEPVFGAGIVVDYVAIHGDGPVSVTVRCVVDDRIRTIEVEADDLLEAYRRVVTAAAELRLTTAWSQVVARS